MIGVVPEVVVLIGVPTVVFVAVAAVGPSPSMEQTELP
jgi:hypothetical protein